MKLCLKSQRGWSVAQLVGCLPNTPQPWITVLGRWKQEDRMFTVILRPGREAGHGQSGLQNENGRMRKRRNDKKIILKARLGDPCL